MCIKKTCWPSSNPTTGGRRRRSRLRPSAMGLVSPPRLTAAKEALAAKLPQPSSHSPDSRHSSKEFPTHGACGQSSRSCLLLARVAELKAKWRQARLWRPRQQRLWRPPLLELSWSVLLALTCFSTAPLWMYGGSRVHVPHLLARHSCVLRVMAGVVRLSAASLGLLCRDSRIITLDSQVMIFDNSRLLSDDSGLLTILDSYLITLVSLLLITGVSLLLQDSCLSSHDGCHSSAFDFILSSSPCRCGGQRRFTQKADRCCLEKAWNGWAAWCRRILNARNTRNTRDRG